MLARFRAALDACAVSALALLAAATILSLASSALGDVQHGDDWDAATSSRQVNVVAGTVSVTEPVSVDDNAGSLTVDSPQLPAALGAGVEAGALRVTIATDSTGVVSVDDNAASLTVDSTQLPAALTVGGNLSCAVAEELPAGTQNIGDVDVLSLPALVAGTANIGDVDVLTVPAPLNVVGTGLEATALRVTLASDSTGVLSVDDGAGSLTVDGTVTCTDGAGSLTVDGTVTVGSITAGDNNIGNVDIVTVPAPLSTSGGGTEATALRVTLASDSTGLVSVDDGGGAITIDGSVSIVGSTGATGGAPGVGADVTIVANCAANGTTTFTPTAGTYNVCATTSGAAVLLYLCYVDDDAAGTNCATEGEPFGASPTAPDCRVRRLANVAHYCRGDAAADFTLVPLTY